MTPPTQPIPHGGALAQAARRFPAAPRPFIDLSTGINPVPYPIGPLPPAALTRLPEPEDLVRLQHLAAAAYGAPDPAMVVAAPGTQLLISLLPRLLPQARVTVLGPTYAEHAAAWRDAGAAVQETTGIMDLAGAGAAVLCNPNNPDGRVVDRAAMLALAPGLRLLVVDEAFADLEPGLSLVPDLVRLPNAVVLRSFGKTYGLAGLRLGFALAAPPIAALIRQALGPWAVAGPALHAALLALPDRPWRDAARTRLQHDAARLDAMLHRAGCLVLGGTTLFRLVTTPDAESLATHLGQRGILVRGFPDRPGLLRFGLPGPDDWARVEEALPGQPGRTGRAWPGMPSSTA